MISPAGFLITAPNGITKMSELTGVLAVIKKRHTTGGTSV